MSDQYENLLERNVVQILPNKKNLIDLMEDRKIKLYYGIDPTSPNLHLGHAVQLRKLAKFQQLGHQVILLFGTFTARIGDPSGHTNRREPLTDQQIEQNLATYIEQAAKVLDTSEIEIKRNAEWLPQLNFEQVLELASKFTVSQLLERSLFQKRLDNNKEVWIHELLYPIMQGYDSVAMDVDLEIGATDQTFNMLIGRDLQKKYNNKEKFVLTTPMLTGLNGESMSKSKGNTVNLTDSPGGMFGKIMSLRDDLIPEYFKLCTDLPLNEIEKIGQQLQQKDVNPKHLKVKLAREIVTIYHNQEQAEQAEQEFNQVFKEGKVPSEIPEFSIQNLEKKIKLVDLIIKTDLADSKTEAKRLIEQKGIKIDGETQQDWSKKIKIKPGMVLQRGKRKFIKLS